MKNIVLHSSISYDTLQENLNKIKSRLPKEKWDEIYLEIQNEYEPFDDIEYQVICIRYPEN